MESNISGPIKKQDFAYPKDQPQKTIAGAGKEITQLKTCSNPPCLLPSLVVKVPLGHAPSLSAAVDGELAEALDDAALPLPTEHHLHSVNHPNLYQSGNGPRPRGHT